jgi:hypothetical protein
VLERRLPIQLAEVLPPRQSTLVISAFAENGTPVVLRGDDPFRPACAGRRIGTRILAYAELAITETDRRSAARSPPNC